MVFCKTWFYLVLLGWLFAFPHPDTWAIILGQLKFISQIALNAHYAWALKWIPDGTESSKILWFDSAWDEGRHGSDPVRVLLFSGTLNSYVPRLVSAPMGPVPQWLCSKELCNYWLYAPIVLCPKCLSSKLPIPYQQMILSMSPLRIVDLRQTKVVGGEKISGSSEISTSHA